MYISNPSKTKQQPSHDTSMQASLPICWGGRDRQTLCLLDTIATCRQGRRKESQGFSDSQYGWKRLKKAQMSLFSWGLWSSWSLNINKYNTIVFVSHQAAMDRALCVRSSNFQSPVRRMHSGWEAQRLPQISTQGSARYLSWVDW